MLHAYVGMWHSCQVMTLRQPLSSTTSSHEPAGHGIEMLHVRALAHESALGVSNAVCRNGGVLLQFGVVGSGSYTSVFWTSNVVLRAVFDRVSITITTTGIVAMHIKHKPHSGSHIWAYV